MTKYVSVTTISTFKHRYFIPVDDLQKQNTSVPIDGLECQWAEDCVTCNDVEEVSQEWLGETIVDSQIVSEEDMLNIFDHENDYLKGWTIEQKIKHVQDWKSKIK